jgi:hypothetical protein
MLVELRTIRKSYSTRGEKREGFRGHCERSEAIHGTAAEAWIASSRSLLATTAAQQKSAGVPALFIEPTATPLTR